MSSYFFGGFSAYLIVPSGRQSNHSGCCLIQGWSGEHWMAKSSAISRPCACAAATRRRKSSKRAELGMDGVVAALVASRSRRGCRDRPAPASACCCGPCGWSGRSGGSAGSRARRSRGRGRRAGARSRRRRCRGASGSPVCERGNSSYQAANAGGRPVDEDLELVGVAGSVGADARRGASARARSRRAGAASWRP